MIFVNSRALFIIVCATGFTIESLGAAAGRSNSARNSTVKQAKPVYSGLSDANGGSYSKSALGASMKQSGPTSRGGLGLSAWGIIGLIIVIVVGGATAYYVTLFYPIICKKQGKYDIMEHSPV